MKLALITQDFPPEVGGIETYAAELAKRFSSACDKFLVIAPDKPKAKEIDSESPYQVERISSSNSFLGIKGLFSVLPILSRHRIRTIFHTQWQTLLISVIGRRLGVVDSIFVAAHARELLFNPFAKIPVLRRLFESYKRWVLSKGDLFFPVSEYTADLLRRHNISNDQIKVVINGTDPDKFFPFDKKSARKKLGINKSNVLLTITRLVPRKGVDTVLKAFKKVLQNHPESTYVIVGEGEYTDRLKQLAENLGITESVQFAGRVPYKMLNNYYNACDVFVMPSKTITPDIEGFGIVFLEANACGKPVIGTFSGGIPSAVVNNETGLLIEEENPEELAQAICRFFEHPEQAERMGANGRKYVEEKANWDVSASLLLNYIKGTI